MFLLDTLTISTIFIILNNATMNLEKNYHKLIQVSLGHLEYIPMQRKYKCLTLVGDVKLFPNDCTIINIPWIGEKSC